MADTHKFIECGCYTEMVEVSRYDDDNETYLSLWYRGNAGDRLPWRRRFRLCWTVLRRGRGHPDDLVLDDAARRAFIDALLRPGELLGGFNRSISVTSSEAVPTP